MKATGTISDNNVFVPLSEDRVKWKQALEKHKGKTVTIDLSLYRKSRSGEQNRYYWGVVVKLFIEHTGIESKREAHEILKHKILLKTSIINVNGTMTEFQSIDSTAGQKTTEFEDYLQKCREWLALDFDIYVPLPHECPDEHYTFNL